MLNIKTISEDKDFAFAVCNSWPMTYIFSKQQVIKRVARTFCIVLSVFWAAFLKLYLHEQ
jgi:hypothetical protein